MGANNYPSSQLPRKYADKQHREPAKETDTERQTVMRVTFPCTNRGLGNERRFLFEP